MTELFLADTSALVRFYRRQAAPEWGSRVDRGHVGLCAPVRQELLRAAGGQATFYDTDALLQRTFPYVSIRQSVWEETASLQDQLARKGWHQCASPVDLLVAVTAMHHQLTVLHQNSDLETIARITGQPVRRIA